MNAKLIQDWHSQEESVAYLIYRVGRLLRQKTLAVLKEHNIDITPEQWALLLRLAEADGLPQNQLADQAMRDHPNVTRMLDRLVKLGLAERRPNPRDRRSFLIFLTKKARETIEVLVPAIMAARGGVLEGLTHRETSFLLNLLRSMQANLLGR